MENIRELEKDLVKAGVPDRYVKEHSVIEGALNILVNSTVSSKPYVDIFLSHVGEMEIGDRIFCARALTEKGLTKATPFLLSIFNEFSEVEIPNDVDLWAVGNALYIVDDKKAYDSILKICRNQHYGIARQMLMGTLARMKTSSAFECLLSCLDDPSVKAHAIEALGRFGDIRAIEVLEKVSVENGKYEFRAKETALRKLKRKLNSVQK